MSLKKTSVERSKRLASNKLGLVVKSILIARAHVIAMIVSSHSGIFRFKGSKEVCYVLGWSVRSP